MHSWRLASEHAGVSQRCHLSSTASCDMHPLPDRTATTLQLIGIEFDHLAAGTFSLAFEMLHKLAHSPPIRRSSEAAVKRPVIVFLNFDRAADLSRSFTSFTVVALAGGRRRRWCSASFAARACVPRISYVPSSTNPFSRFRRDVVVGCSLVLNGSILRCRRRIFGS